MTLKSLGIYQQPGSFLHLSKLLCQYKSLTPLKSIPENSDFGLRENMHVGTPEPMRIKDTLTKIS